jgi:2-polyprenyl-3-methyl-5-hydroxy-6-metoxy-1,4-benzoquinol methylase
MFQAAYHYGKLLIDPWVEQRLIRTLRIAVDNMPKSRTNAGAARRLENLSILDFGGYEGNLIDIASSRYGSKLANYTVLDGDVKALEVAKAKGANIICRTLDDLNSYSNQGGYDLIFATEVLEHLVAPREVLSVLLAMLNKDGLLIVSLPNENTIVHRLYAILGFGVDSEVFNLYKHLHLPTIKQSRAFVSSQAVIAEYEYWFAFSGGNTRFSFATIKPNSFIGRVMLRVGNFFPSLLARGTIFALVPEERGTNVQ